MTDDDKATIGEIREALPDEYLSYRMADLVDKRSDFLNLRKEWFKPLAKIIRDAGYNCEVEDLLALSNNSDPFYILPSEKEQAEWYGQVDDLEGNPTTHPRGMHYSILEKYNDRNGDTYVGDTSQWGEVLTGARYAGLVGEVPIGRINDGKNSNPSGESFTGSDTGLPSDLNFYSGAYSGYYDPGVGSSVTNPELSKEVEEIIERAAEKFTKMVFRDVKFEGKKVQPFRFEIMCEKSGIIPNSFRHEYGATLRPADGGDPSARMCEDAVRLADERDQGLVVIMLSDFDGKGNDMPKSVASKTQAEADLKDVEAYVHHAALTKEQVAKLDLKFAPGTVPQGADKGTSGAKAFQKTNELFAEFAGEDGKIEINALANDYPDVLYDSIEECIEPYYDHERDEQLREAVYQERERFKNAVINRFKNQRGEIEDAYNDLEAAIETYKKEIDNGEINELEDDISHIEDRISQLRSELEHKKDILSKKEREIRDDVSLKEKNSELDTALDVDLDPVLSEFEIDLPESEVERRDDAILDTRRTWIEQLDAYREFDYRWNDRIDMDSPPSSEAASD